MENEHLKLEVENFTAQQKAVYKRRDLWNQEKRDLIESVLTEIVIKFQLDCSIERRTEMKNHQAISLVFHTKNSGIIKYSEGKSKAYDKIGAALHFMQKYTGRIDIRMQYPEIEEISERTTILPISSVLPEDIDKDYVQSVFIKFLNLVTEWEDIGG